VASDPGIYRYVFPVISYSCVKPIYPMSTWSESAPHTLPHARFRILGAIMTPRDATMTRRGLVILFIPHTKLLS